MKLLFDANLSPKLVGRLGELFPGSEHVFDTGLARSTSDEKIWKYAAVRRSRELTMLCSPKMTHLTARMRCCAEHARRRMARLTISTPHASGVDNIAPASSCNVIYNDACPRKRWWVTLSERKWVTIGERRGESTLALTTSMTSQARRFRLTAPSASRANRFPAPGTSCISDCAPGQAP